MSLAGSNDPLSLVMVADYFRRLYHYKDDGGLDEKKILPKHEEGGRELSFPFEDIADAFRIIEEGSKDVIIPFDKNACSKISELRSTEFPGKLIRDLQGYTISIYPNEFREMERQNAVECIGERFYILRSCEDYSDETGLKPRQDAGYDGSLMCS